MRKWTNNSYLTKSYHLLGNNLTTGTKLQIRSDFASQFVFYCRVCSCVHCVHYSNSNEIQSAFLQGHVVCSLGDFSLCLEATIIVRIGKYNGISLGSIKEC
jgi:hypothetical protein